MILFTASAAIHHHSRSLPEAAQPSLHADNIPTEFICRYNREGIRREKRIASRDKEHTEECVRSHNPVKRALATV